jgi:nicotinamide-nucleotide amidase
MSSRSTSKSARKLGPDPGPGIGASGESLRAEIITIGDEILRGEIVDSNKSLMSERLLSVDVETRFQTSVLDHRDEMADAFERAVGRSDVVLVSGGLGPTRDDITTEVVARTFDREIRLDSAVLENIRAFFRALGREMSENNAKQAYFPQGADVLANPVGTAPGFMIEERGSLIFAMPGVPRELSLMLDAEVLPRIARRIGSAPVMRARLLRTFGLGESSLDSELEHIAQEEGVALGFRTTFPDNYLRPVVRADTPEAAEAKLDAMCVEIRDHLGALVYGQDDETMAAVMGKLLVEQNATIAVAESCTGGLLAELITDVPGASEYFAGGIVSYSNEAKMSLLGVPASELESFGAVSESVAISMAEGVRERFDTEFGVSTTGIAGPGGGSDEKPVGLVHVALARRGRKTHADHFVFPLDRMRHRRLTAQVALDWVRRSLLEVELVSPSLLRRRGGATLSAPVPLEPKGPKGPEGARR